MADQILKSKVATEGTGKVAAKKKPLPFRIEKSSGPELFAGAGSALPSDPMQHPAYYERVPVLEVTQGLLCRAMLQLNAHYQEYGVFEIAEVGSYRGRGTKAILDLAVSLGVQVHVPGLDSFEGLPPLSGKDAELAPVNAAYRTRVLFADVTEREVRAYIGSAHEGSFTLVKGFFIETLPTLPEKQYLMAIIDCDLYSSHMDSMSYFYERLLPGGIMFFDDYHSGQYPMAKQAINEFLEEKPEKLFHIGFATPKGNNVKTYIIKQ